ncbi:sodium:proton antiporter [Kytococcus schroeteri]|uniref:Sodium:proton antiporter n=1 Tax=Kytococcus schroeteri TaxID=138300 RepID=A0A2I1PDB5_9MICO|nr:dicarboxylate/amino acid:cation symporter [Kytococcus schroeteri]PKZ42632.1 sodium:proton antiporter [Kytococcus schroeteri]
MTSDSPSRSRWFGLLPRIVLAIVLGILVGRIAPEALTRTVATFNGLFSNFLGFVIPLIILGLIAPAIGELGRGAGKWLALTAALAYGSTLFAGFLGYAVSSAVLPDLLRGRSTPQLGNPEDALLAPWFEIEMDPAFGVMTALLLAFTVGVGMTMIKGDTLQRGFEEFREIVNKVISGIIIPLLPVYIFGVFLNMTAAGEVWNVITTFSGVILLVFALTVALLLMQFGVAGAVSGRNPLVLLKNMLPAYATALGTSSSAATIPVTLRQSLKNGVSEPVASFVVPLCATIHLAGSTVKLTCFSMAVMMLSGMEVHPGTMVGFILLLGIMMIAAPGVPGGAVMAAVALMESNLGFNEAQVGLMIATYIAIDSFGTATNVTGDGAIAQVVDRLARNRGFGRHGQEETARDEATTGVSPAAGVAATRTA